MSNKLNFATLKKNIKNNKKEHPRITIENGVLTTPTIEVRVAIKKNPTKLKIRLDVTIFNFTLAPHNLMNIKFSIL